MGYEVNPPTKKIWIPIEYVWLSEKADNVSFSEFNEEYKKRYGIDLMEIVKLDGNSIVSKGDVSTYIVPDAVYKVSFVDNCPTSIVSTYRSEENDGITNIQCADTSATLGFGVQFLIPKSSPFAYESIVVNFHEC